MASDHQLTFNGLTLGTGTPYPIRDLTGFDEFSVGDADVNFPQQWGAMPGLDLVGKKVITMTVLVATLPDLPAIENAFVPSPAATSYVLTAKHPEYTEERQVSCRCRRRARVHTMETEFGLVPVAIQLVAHDPRLYGTTLFSSGVSPFVAEQNGFELTAGAGADLGFDLTADVADNIGFDMTGIPSSGLVTVNNAGNTDTYPSMLFSPDGSGPMTNWSLSNLTNGDVATFALTLNPGSTLLADMAIVATAKQGDPITSGGSAVYSTWQQPRTPLRISPGNNVLRFDVTGGVAGNASCVLTYRNARI